MTIFWVSNQPTNIPTNQASNHPTNQPTNKQTEQTTIHSRKSKHYSFLMSQKSSCFAAAWDLAPCPHFHYLPNFLLHHQAGDRNGKVSNFRWLRDRKIGSGILSSSARGVPNIQRARTVIWDSVSVTPTPLILPIQCVLSHKTRPDGVFWIPRSLTNKQTAFLSDPSVSTLEPNITSVIKLKFQTKLSLQVLSLTV